MILMSNNNIASLQTDNGLLSSLCEEERGRAEETDINSLGVGYRLKKKTLKNFE